jgi:pyruvate kinase
VTIYRGVYPVAFDIPRDSRRSLFQSVFDMLLELELAAEGDQIILTQGELTGVQGGTNSLQILTVHRALA